MQSGHGCQTFQQAREGVLFPTFPAIGGHILGNEHEFAAALSQTVPGVVQYFLLRPAAEGAPDGGDGAEPAAVIASFGDLQIGIPRGRGQQPGPDIRQLPTQQLANAAAQLAMPGDLQEKVHLGQFPGQILSIPGDEAARDHQQGFGVSPGQGLGCVQDDLQRFAHGRLDESAGIDQDHLGLLGRGRVDKAGAESPSIHSVSTRFLGQPRLMACMRIFSITPPHPERYPAQARTPPGPC